MFTNEVTAKTLVADHIRDLETTARNQQAMKFRAGPLSRLRRSRWGPPTGADTPSAPTTNSTTAERAHPAATDRTSVAAGERKAAA